MPPDPSTVPLKDRPPIVAAPTGVAAFIGRFQRGPVDVAIPLTSREDAAGQLGPPLRDGDAALAVEQFFVNGGERAYAVRVAAEEEPRDPPVAPGPALVDGLQVLAGLDDLEVVCLPDAARLAPAAAATLHLTAAAFCASQRLILLVDPPRDVREADAVVDWVTDGDVRSPDAAMYVPRVVTELPDGSTRTIAACGAVAGIYARTARARGVWKSPAGTEADLRGITGLEVALREIDQSRLGPLGINVLRRMAPGDDLVWGGRTLAGHDGGDPSWRYVAVRRTALLIERSLTRSLAWTATEPHAEPLWAAVRSRTQDFLHDLWRRGAFQGVTPAQGYLLRCGLGVTMTPADVDAGVLLLEVGFAPLKPAEFVVLRLRLAAGGEADADAFPGQERLAGVGLEQLGRSAGDRHALERALARAARGLEPSHAPRRTRRSPSPAPRGRRIVFAGPSGEDKTLAVRALAADLGVDVIRVDLGQVASEHVTQTEARLDRLLAAAEAGDVLLFFDEADALFGRRSQVADAPGRASHRDRPVLARLEGHPGVIVFATEAPAATRRARAAADAVVRFPRPRRPSPSA